MTIGERIKAFRLSAGLTQVEFAKNLNVSRYFLSLLEKNEKELSDATAGLLLNFISENEVPKDFKTSFRKGKNFTKIIEAIRTTGVSLNQLRDVDFMVKGSELSSMYIGLKPISENIRKILQGKYQVNLEFISLGKKVPMFTNLSIEDSEIEFPYFTNQTVKESLDSYKDLKFENSLKISIPKINVDLFLDIFGDNMSPTFKGREILGIKLVPLENINFGSMYVIQLFNGECQLRRVFQSSNDSQVILKKEDAEFPEVIIKINSIQNLFVVKTVIVKDFY